MKRQRWVVGGAVAVLLVAALGWWRGRGEAAVSVDAGEAELREALRAYVTASGEIVASRYADIGSSVMGRIVRLPVKEGDQVVAGQVLAQIDRAQAASAADAAAAQLGALEADVRAAEGQVESARAEVALSEARLKEAAASLRRENELMTQELTTRAALDAAQAAADTARAQVDAAGAALRRAEEARTAAARRVAQARAQVAGARDLLAKTEITAPISGVITRLQVREGEMVVIGVQNQPGTILMTISDLSEIDAEVKVAEADVLRLRVDQRADVLLEAVPGRRFAGRVIEVGASALPVTGTQAAREFRVVIRLDQPDAALRPGLTCDAEILTAERKGVTTVPLQSVVVRRGGEAGEERTGVFAIDGDRARFVPVETGIIGGLDIEVSGIDPGRRIVTGPYQVLRELQPDARVRSANR